MKYTYKICLWLGCCLWGVVLTAQDTNIDTLPYSDTTIYRVVEAMPLFWGCEELKETHQEKKRCADQALLKFLYTNIKAPHGVQVYQVEGVVVASFVIEKDGSISNIEILRDVGAGWGAAVCDVLHLMQQSPNRWTSGQQNGKAVRVEYRVPIRVHLH